MDSTLSSPETTQEPAAGADSTGADGQHVPQAGPIASLTDRIRGNLAEKGGPTRLVLMVALIVAAIWGAGAGPYVQLIGQSCAIFAIAAIGQSLLVGGAGQIALSGGAFMGVGAFTAGILVQQGVTNPLLVLLASAVVGWIVGVISGLPGLRFRGLYLLLASLALQFIFQSFAKLYQADHSPAGLVVPPLTLGSLDLSFGANLYWALVIVLLVIYAACAAVERTGVGLAWRALKESEVAAAVSGVDVVRWKLYAFAGSGAVMAIAGCLFAYWVGRADYESYSLNVSIAIVTMVYIGGIRSRLGAVVGAVVITVLPYFLQSQVSVWLVNAGVSFDWYLNNVSTVNAGIFSGLFLLVIVFEPDGIEGLATKAEDGIRALLRGRRRTAPPTPAVDEAAS
jgi:branched-chain amino acid transport system permease protein